MSLEVRHFIPATVAVGPPSSPPTETAPHWQLGRVVRHDAVGAVGHELWIEAPAWTHARPGQIVHVRCHPAGRIPLFVASVGQGVLAVGFRVRDAATAWLSTVPMGASLDVFGLVGEGFDAPGPDDRILAVAGGRGIVPLAFYAERYPLAHMAIQAGFRHQARANGFARALRAGVPVQVVTEDGSIGDLGLATDGLKDRILRQHISRVLACGPMPMLRTVAAAAAECGLPCQVAIECKPGGGVGGDPACGVAIRGRHGGIRVQRGCDDGPVFDAATMVWDDR